VTHRGSTTSHSPGFFAAGPAATLDWPDATEVAEPRRERDLSPEATPDALVPNFLAAASPAVGVFGFAAAAARGAVDSVAATRPAIALTRCADFALAVSNALNGAGSTSEPDFVVMYFTKAPKLASAASRTSFELSPQP
jgi:hypothetical protein